MPSFSGETRRRVAWKGQAGACSLTVPVYANPDGDLREGRFDVPARLASTAPNTNERYEFERVLRGNFNRWTDWLSKRGWTYVVGTLHVDGPHDKPTANASEMVDEERKEYHLLARFKRNNPLYVGLDDVLEVRDMALRYGVGEASTPWSEVKGEDSGWVNPLEYAQRRRERLGLKRDDFLLGPLDEPL